MNRSPARTPAQSSPTARTTVEPGRLAGLRRYNLIVGVVLLVQAVAVVALANDFTLPVTASYLEGPPGTTPGDPVTLLNTPIGLAVAGFLALSGLALVIVATVWSKGYAADLARQRNRARWVEYAVTSSMMIVLIAQITGLTDVGALTAIFNVFALNQYLQYKQVGRWADYLAGERPTSP